ncbi:MAG: ChbG/HpnK family deacetylase [Candidatus Buchananbacteria bacterium]|nr:ChbG/HpnK family deacetylase [Candidatus Buchananbacteria bacterium]
MKYLIINADDFGTSKIFNEVILNLIKKDLVRSTTVMVNRITDDQQNQLAELISLLKTKNLSVGLHLEFKEGQNDYETQIKSQYQKFKEILNFDPSHIDIHRFKDFKDSYPLVADFCQQNNLPVRNRGEVFEKCKTTATPAFFGTVKKFREIKNWLKSLEDQKYYEILMHPGKFDPNCKSNLNKKRKKDTKHIKKLNKILKKNDIKPISYFELN